MTAFANIGHRPRRAIAIDEVSPTTPASIGLSNMAPTPIASPERFSRPRSMRMLTVLSRTTAALR